MMIFHIGDTVLEWSLPTGLTSLVVWAANVYARVALFVDDFQGKPFDICFSSPFQMPLFPRRHLF